MDVTQGFSHNNSCDRIEGPTVFSRRTEPSPTVVFDTYWKFAAERQAIYFRRLTGARGPWTSDSILGTYKFTNAYRAADRVSQYLIQRVIYGGAYSDEDTIFRVLLFKLFNKIETWELLESYFGELTLANFNVSAFDKVLTDALTKGLKVYSAAYIMPNAPRMAESSFKHRTHLDLLSNAMQHGLKDRLQEARSMEVAFNELLALPSIGPFLAYQYVIDLNYTECLSFSENDFVQPGPGALNGLKKCFASLGDYSAADAIRWVTERQDIEFQTRDLEFRSLWGRSLHLIDCQNLFCEVDKYARVAHPEFSDATGRSRIKQKFSPQAKSANPWFPPKWRINEAIATKKADESPDPMQSRPILSRIAVHQSQAVLSF